MAPVWFGAVPGPGCDFRNRVDARGVGAPYAMDGRFDAVVLVKWNRFRSLRRYGSKIQAPTVQLGFSEFCVALRASYCEV